MFSKRTKKRVSDEYIMVMVLFYYYAYPLESTINFEIVENYEIVNFLCVLNTLLNFKPKTYICCFAAAVKHTK